VFQLTSAICSLGAVRVHLPRHHLVAFHHTHESRDGETCPAGYRTTRDRGSRGYPTRHGWVREPTPSMATAGKHERIFACPRAVRVVSAMTPTNPVRDESLGTPNCHERISARHTS
jgi:hypothetical protein